MKSNLQFLAIALLLFSCSPPKEQSGNTDTNPSIVGTWKLLSGMTIEKGDTTLTDYTKNQKFIKIINDTHFCFLRHDLTNGKDTSSAIFVSGGGSYTLKGNQYTENLEFCSARDWENHSFDFTVTIKGDTLVQKGIEKLEELGVERINIEKYIRIRE